MHKRAMATIPIGPDPLPSRLPAIWRWAAPLAALGLLFVIGGGLGLAQQLQQDYRDVLSSAVFARWAEGGVGPLAQAAVLLALWVLWRVGRKVLLFGAFLFVERGLSGPLADARTFRFALAVQLSIALLYAVAATFLLIFAPFPAMPEPVLNLGQAEAESLLGPLAPVAIALVALLAYDFLDYWVHRAQHRFAFLWRFHAVHHSVEEMDSLNSYSHPVDLLASYAAFILFSVWIGFSFETMLWFLAFQTIHDRLKHTRAPINFGVLGAVLVDNRTHFVHHVRTEARAGKNFAGTFTIFDRLFGTYQQPEAGALSAHGLEGQSPPATIADFFLARLGARPSAGTVASDCPQSVSERPAAGCRPSA
jgi:sterol desaturase/sphingolipid hydroxylase (fatty acid hydroxylase superfamily)